MIAQFSRSCSHIQYNVLNISLYLKVIANINIDAEDINKLKDKINELKAKICILEE